MGPITFEKLTVHWAFQQESLLQLWPASSEHTVDALNAPNRHTLWCVSRQEFSKIRNIVSLKIFLCSVTATFSAQSLYVGSNNNKGPLEPFTSRIMQYLWSVKIRVSYDTFSRKWGLHFLCKAWGLYFFEKMLFYDTGKYLLLWVQNVQCNYEELHHSVRCMLSMRLTVIFRNVSGVKTFQDWKISINHYYLGAKSQIYSLSEWRITLWHSSNKLHFFCRYILRKFWTEKCSVSYDAIFIVPNVVSIFCTKLVAPFFGKIFHMILEKDLFCRESRISAVTMTGVIKPYVECTGCT